MKIEEYNTAIIGAGIVGSGIFRDLSLHNISTVIIDKSDFSSKTSQNSSKMLHGGIRYLENMDFELVYEALHEKNLWIKIAPHLCYEERFYLPVFSDAKRPLWMIRIGLFLYDFLSGFQNTLHKIIDSKETKQNIPCLCEENLSGSGLYSDAIVDDCKMTLELIYDGLQSKNSKAYNYCELIDDKNEGDYHFLKIKNNLTGEFTNIKAKNIIYATGPFTDDLLKKQFPKWKNILLPSKGSHLWFSKKDFPLDHPVVMTTKDDRVIFVIPQNDLILVGTTEVKVQESLDNLNVSKSEIKYLLQMLATYFPALKLTEDNILGSFSGVRPLVRENDDSSLGKTSREHKIIQPNNNTFIIVGGKYTTFRVMGQSISRIIVESLGRTYKEHLSTLPLRIKSIIPSFKFTIPNDIELETILKNELPKTFDDLVSRRLGINSKKIWGHKTQIDFDTYFKSKIQILNLYMKVEIAEIENFKEY